MGIRSEKWYAKMMKMEIIAHGDKAISFALWMLAKRGFDPFDKFVETRQKGNKKNFVYTGIAMDEDSCKTFAKECRECSSIRTTVTLRNDVIEIFIR